MCIRDRHNPEGANAFYYLGCLFYDKFRYSEAVKCWEECVRIDPGHGKAYRNLALAYYDEQNDKRSARLCMETARFGELVRSFFAAEGKTGR